VVDEVNRIRKGRIVLAGPWTSVCIVGPAALDQSFEVHVIPDACGDVSLNHMSARRNGSYMQTLGR